MSAAQISSIAPGSCAGITAAQVGLLGSTAPYDTCTGLSSACMAEFSPPALGALGAACVAMVPPSVLPSFTLAQIRLVSDAVVPTLSTPTLVAWTHAFGLRFVAGAWPSVARAELLRDDAVLGMKLVVYIGENYQHYLCASRAGGARETGSHF